MPTAGYNPERDERLEPVFRSWRRFTWVLGHEVPDRLARVRTYTRATRRRYGK